MRFFAEIDKDGVVQRVIVAEPDFIDTGGVGDPKLWIETSHNKNFRKNYAGVGFTYDKVRDAFYEAQPYDSWILNEDTCQWDAPVSYPDDDKEYNWNKDTQAWDEIPE